MSQGIGFDDAALAFLVAKEAFALVGKAIDAIKKNGKNSNGKKGEPTEECRRQFNAIQKALDSIQTSVVAPDRQPLHVTVRSILAKVSKE